MIRNNCVLLLLLLVLSCDAFRKFISLRGTHRSKLQADTFLCSHEKLGENSFENDPTDKILAGFEERLIEDVYTDKDIEKLAEDGSDSSLEDVVKVSCKAANNNLPPS